MSKSDEYEKEEQTNTITIIDEKGIENKQNNALLYLILKEGYKLTIKKSSNVKSPKVPKSLDNQNKSKTKKTPTYKCIEIHHQDEKLSEEELLELGKEMDDLIQMKIKQKESQLDRSFNKENDYIIIEPKDLFSDGNGIESEQSISMKQNTYPNTL